MSVSETVSGEFGHTGPRLIAPELIERHEGRLRLKGGACRACGALSFPRAEVCAECLSLDVEDRLLSEEGELYSSSRVHMAPKGWDVPYVIGYVDLPEGLRVLAHIDDSHSDPRIGAKLRLSEGRVGVAPDGEVLTSYIFVPLEGAP